MAIKQFYINGTGSGSFGIYITSDTYLNAPEPDYTAHQIPGRSGDLLQWNKRLGNVIRKFECYIKDNAQANLDAFKKYIYSQAPFGYMEVSSDYETDTFQRGYLAQDIQTEPFQADDKLTVSFEVLFSCQPQKYFKENEETEITISPYADFYLNNARILPRSHKFIQKMLQLIPADDAPAGDAFAFINIYGTKKITFSMPGYSGFVAYVYGTNFLYPYRSDAQVTGLVGYSYTGSLDTMDATAGANPFGIILPASAAGTFTYKSYTDGGQEYSTVSLTMAPQGEAENEAALGVGYKIEVGGTYGTGGAESVDGTANGIYVVGTLNGKESFSGLIDIDVTQLKSRASGSNTYPVTITIDSQDLTVTATFDGEPIQLTSGIGVNGALGGMADKISVYVYQIQDSHVQTPLYIEELTITPNWWKV